MGWARERKKKRRRSVEYWPYVSSSINSNLKMMPTLGTSRPQCCCLKKNQSAPRPSEHPPVRGEIYLVPPWAHLVLRGRFWREQFRRSVFFCGHLRNGNDLIFVGGFGPKEKTIDKMELVYVLQENSRN